VTPADINGTGRVLQYNNGSYSGTSLASSDVGADQWGRVVYYSYFRPPGLPGQVTTTPPGTTPSSYTTAVTFPWTSMEAYPNTLLSNVTTGPLAGSLYEDSNPLHGYEAQRFPNLQYTTPVTANSFKPQRAGGVPFDLNANANLAYVPGTLPTYDPMVNSSQNVLSDGLNEADEMNLYVPNAQLDSPFGFADLEWLYRQQDVDGSSLVSRLAQLAPISFSNPVDGQRRRRLFALDSWETNNFVWTNDNPGNAFPNNTNFSPSFTGTLTSGSNAVTGISSTAGLFPGQTVGGTGILTGTTIVSVAAGGITLSTNATVTGPEQLNVLNQNASFVQLGVNQNTTSPTPPLAHRDKKINLNYPLPVSNDPNEPVRQKWINDTYYTLKAILPPLSVDSAEELAQLSQFVINIVDFRDTDATMTHWTNPDVYLRTSATTSPYPVLATAGYNAATDLPLSQYGMEYNPIAINEVLAYSFATTPKPTNRFYIELVNTLTSPELGTVANAGLGVAPNTGSNNASVLDLAGFQSNPNPPMPATPPPTPWDGGCWDLLVTDDLPQSRPDPVLGQLLPGGNYYGLLPFSTWTTGGSMIVNTTAPAAPAGDPVLFPLPQSMPPQANANPGNLFLGYFAPPLTPNNPLAPLYFTTIGNPTPGGNVESQAYVPTYSLNTAWDFINYTNGVTPPTNPVAAGVIPPASVAQAITNPPTYPTAYTALKTMPNLAAGSGTGTMYWVCLRRPANPFAPVSATNPMIVVDSMRFPYIESGGTTTTTGSTPMFSYQRLQPFRGGHAVPLNGGVATTTPIDPRYGYSEQVSAPATSTANVGHTGSGGFPITGSNMFFHTLGAPNDVGGTPNGWNPGAPAVGGAKPIPVIPPYLLEPWDYYTFNDRDFTSVAELLLVPGCPPGLFTKQFAEFAPSAANVTNIFSQVTPLATGPSTTNAVKPLVPSATAPVKATASLPFNASLTTTPLTPHAFPYLVDKFFYTAASPATVPSNATFGDQTGDGWFKMFEFFEVPSQMIGAVGPVTQGTDFDWLRQDKKPGLINLNLIIDEEVFCSVFGLQDSSFTQRFLNFAQLPYLPLSSFQGASIVQSPGTFNATTATATTLPMVAGQSPVPMVVTATTAYGSPASAYPMTNVGVLATDPVNGIGNGMKAAFAQFLSLRHGGSGYVFGYGSGLPGQNMTVFTGNTNGPTTPAQAMVSPIPADRPFHSVSYPDIDYTIMRPAALPPFNYPTTPVTSTDPPPNTPATSWPPYYNNSWATSYTADPGLRNSMVYEGFTSASLIAAPNTGTTPQSTPTTSIAAPTTIPFLLPPAIPPRRLFQPPDSLWSTAANTTPPPTNIITASNASDTADPYLNNLVPVNATAATGALPLFQATPPTNNVVNLFWPAGTTLPPLTPTTTPPPYIPSPYLGANWVPGPPLVPDMKQHPYFRTEAMQKAMNLTTVRTHQYAVWITIGFFEVARQGDLLMIQQGNPVLAYDMIGPEIGASTGQTTRYRGFFLVDRLKLYSFDDTTPGSFRPAVVYRQMIE